MSTMITIVGKSGSGKSTVASNLAMLLARKHNSLVAVLSCDLSYPSVPQYFKCEIPPENSVGLLLQHHSPECMMAETSEGSNIFVTGPTANSTCFTAEPPSGDQIELMFAKLKMAYDYVIVEANEPLINYMSAVALSVADLVVTVIPATVQGQRWQAAYEELITVYAPNTPRINVLNMAGVCIDTDAVTAELAPLSVHYILPWHVTIMQTESTGLPICADEKQKNVRTVRDYCKAMESLAATIVEGVEEDEAETGDSNEVEGSKGE